MLKHGQPTNPDGSFATDEEIRAWWSREGEQALINELSRVYEESLERLEASRMDRFERSEQRWLSGEVGRPAPSNINALVRQFRLTCTVRNRNQTDPVRRTRLIYYEFWRCTSGRLDKEMLWAMGVVGLVGGIAGRVKGPTPKLLPSVSQSTQQQIEALMAEHPGLSRANAELALRGPPGANATLSGNTPEIPTQPKAADIEFRHATPDGNVVVRREVKVFQGGQSSFNYEVSKGAEQVLAGGSGGEIFVQAPAASDARLLLQRFKGAGGGSGGLSRDQMAQRLGWYRSIKVTIRDPSGAVLIDEFLELPPLRLPQSQ